MKKLNKVFASLIVVVCLGQTVNAQTQVLVQAPGVTSAAFAAILSEQKEYRSLSDYAESLSPLPEQVEHLLKIFESAQRHYFSGHDELARASFLEVTKMSPAADWQEVHRQVIFYSFLRLAQMTSQSQDRQNLLEAAISFAPDLLPDNTLFPPPLMSSWKQVHFTLEKRASLISTEEKFPGYDILKINGHSVDIKTIKSVLLFPGSHRISLLSNSHPYFSQTLNSSQLELLKVDTVALVYGSCDTPGLNGFKDLNLSEVSVMYDSDCLRTYTGTGWVKPNKQISPAFTPQQVPGSLLAQTEAPSHPAKRKLLWLGLSALVLGSAYLIYKNAHQAHGQPPADNPLPATPTVTQGF